MEEEINTPYTSVSMRGNGKMGGNETHGVRHTAVISVVVTELFKQIHIAMNIQVRAFEKKRTGVKRKRKRKRVSYGKESHACWKNPLLPSRGQITQKGMATQCHFYGIKQITPQTNPSERGFIKPFNQSTNQPINQSTNQPINQSTNQPINQSTNQPCKLCS
jgi:hypothetical protein